MWIGERGHAYTNDMVNLCHMQYNSLGSMQLRVAGKTRNNIPRRKKHLDLHIITTVRLTCFPPHPPFYRFGFCFVESYFSHRKMHKYVDLFHLKCKLSSRAGGITPATRSMKTWNTVFPRLLVGGDRNPMAVRTCSLNAGSVV